MVLCPLLLTLCHWLGKDSLLIIAALASSAVTSFMTAFATKSEHIFYSKTSRKISTSSLLFSLCLRVDNGRNAAGVPILPAPNGRQRRDRPSANRSHHHNLVLPNSLIPHLQLHLQCHTLLVAWIRFFRFGVLPVLRFHWSDVSLSSPILFELRLSYSCVHMLMRPQWKLDKQLRARREEETDSRDDVDFRPVAEAEQRSISNTAVDSDSGSPRGL